MARILVVEDTPHNLELVTYLLRAVGHRIDPATTAAAAVEQARARRPDLVLLDVHLPDGDGFEVLAVLRADPALCEVPVIAVTAYAMLGDREHAVAAGFDAYLTKPIDPHTFAATIGGYLPDNGRATSAVDGAATGQTGR